MASQQSFDHPNLHLYAIAPEQLLAMKVQAGRPTDAADIATLCCVLAITTVDEVETATRAGFPDQTPSTRGLALAGDVLAEPSPPGTS